MKITNDPLRFESPLYTVREAARYLSVPVSTLSSWTRPRDQYGPVVTTVGIAARHQPVMPFVGLAEAMVVTAFRRQNGVSMQYIRKALKAIEQDIGLEHALASRKLYTDGASILYDHAKTHEETKLLTEVVSNNYVFTEVVRSYLQLISYSNDGWAEKVILPLTRRPIVEVDPRRGYGHPLFIRGGAGMDDVLLRFRAGDELEDLAEDFGVDLTDLLDVLRAVIPADEAA